MTTNGLTGTSLPGEVSNPRRVRQREHPKRVKQPPVLNPGDLPRQRQPINPFNNPKNRHPGWQRPQNSPKGNRSSNVPDKQVVGRAVTGHKPPFGPSKGNPLPDPHLPPPTSPGPIPGVIEHAKLEPPVVVPDGVGTQRKPTNPHANMLPRHPPKPKQRVPLNPDPPHPRGDILNSTNRAPQEEPFAHAPHDGG
jgi:hypothetical protein